MFCPRSPKMSERTSRLYTMKYTYYNYGQSSWLLKCSISDQIWKMNKSELASTAAMSREYCKPGEKSKQMASHSYDTIGGLIIFGCFQK